MMSRLLHLFIVVCTVVNVVNSTVATTRSLAGGASLDDKSILKSIASTLKLRGGVNFGWDDTLDPCVDLWPGVECDSSNLNVRKIDFNNYPSSNAGYCASGNVVADGESIDGRERVKNSSTVITFSNVL